ncbi:hypothetical protein A3H77_02365 [Candidatus Kaiserbacteria bacterium RIFCSPLOWO2_02_FULL_56_11]|nr:MAG: hypothetical protein A3H77_02365 [Candidatus Kaiserbacteria bacterium RIFCSPLOWO2_02_FULL_56_11]
MKNILVVPIAIVTAGIIVASAVYLSIGDFTAPAGGNPSAVRAVDASDHILGNPRARVKIVEYSDFDCRYCKTFHATLHQLLDDYGTGGEVAWVFRNFALTELHPNAKKHAKAAECVAQTAGNTVYWAFADLLFANQPTNPLAYAEYAQAVGAISETVAACIQSASDIDARIDADRKNALEIGAVGTPYSVLIVDDVAVATIDGAQSYADLKDAIDAVLAP